MPKFALVAIDVGYAFAGIIINDKGCCVEAAPIYKWMKGKSMPQIKKWKKIKEVTLVSTFEGKII